MSGSTGPEIESWEGEGGAVPGALNPYPASMSGTVNQVEWALRIKRQVNEDFDRVAATLMAITRRQNGAKRAETEAIVAILEDKRAEVPPSVLNPTGRLGADIRSRVGEASPSIGLAPIGEPKCQGFQSSAVNVSRRQLDSDSPPGLSGPVFSPRGRTGRAGACGLADRQIPHSECKICAPPMLRFRARGIHSGSAYCFAPLGIHAVDGLTSSRPEENDRTSSARSYREP